MPTAADLTLTFNAPTKTPPSLNSKNTLGCNLRGYFNTSNTTSIESQAEAMKTNRGDTSATPYFKIDSQMRVKVTTDLGDIEMKTEKLGEKDIKKEDGYRLYKNFWAVQKYINNPI